MRVLLLTLSGDPELARGAIRIRWPGAEIVPLERRVLDRGGLTAPFLTARQMRPDVFVVMTESIDWQYGQDALTFFGALAGAKSSFIIDPRGRARFEPRSNLLARSPARLALAFLKGKAAIRRAATALTRLEHAAKGVIVKPHAPAHNPKVAYIRATPAAGTQPGGSTSHINGVVNALLSLGSRIDFISNDEIAGLDKSQLSFTRIPPDSRVMPRAAFDVHNGMRFSTASAHIVEASPPTLSISVTADSHTPVSRPACARAGRFSLSTTVPRSGWESIGTGRSGSICSNGTRD